MPLKIQTNIKRLSLHDSHFEKIVRKGQNIELTFDWAKLENYAEQGIEDGLVLGKTKVAINGICNEEFKSYYNGEKWETIESPNDIVDSWQEVANTEIDEKLQRIQLDGMFNTEQEHFWIEWSFNYKNCEIEWNNDVTLKK